MIAGGGPAIAGRTTNHGHSSDSPIQVIVMQHMRQVEVRTYRGCHLEILDDGGDGWVVAVHNPDTSDRVLLRNSMPNGLAVLLEEAEARVDRRLGKVSFPDYP